MQTIRSVISIGMAALALTLTAGETWAGPPAAQPSTVVKEVVVTAAVRPKPTDTPPPLDDYATPAQFEQVALSPDGSQIAFVETRGGVRRLATYRFADRSTRAVDLLYGKESSIAWADDDHILISVGASTPRGTCDVRDQRTQQMNAMAEGMVLEQLGQSASGPSAPAATMSANQGASSLQAAAASNTCVYYGVREQSKVILASMVTKRGTLIGPNYGDFPNRPLGTPTPVSIDGQGRVAGPFLEVRDTPQLVGPAERVLLWSIDPKTSLARMIDDHGGDRGRVSFYVDDWLLDRKGALAARSLYDFRKKSFVIQMKTDGAWKPVLTRPVTTQDHTFAPYMIGLGRQDGSIVILDARDGDAGGRVFHYFELASDGSVSGPLEPDDAVRDRPILDPATGRLAGFVQAGVSDSYILFNPDRQAIYQRAQAAAPGESVSVVATADDPRKLVIHATGRDDPGSYYVIDFATGASIELGEDYPQVPTAWIAPQSEISYKAADGLEIDALLTVPPGAKLQGLPLIVLPHDGPQTHDRVGFNWLAQALASRGYLVLQPNYRGSDGYGRTFMQAGYGDLGRRMQSDLSDGVRYLAAQGFADSKRVCIVGIGLGGYAALTAAATEAGTWRCAASVNGVSDPYAYAAWLKHRQASPDQDQITTLSADLAQARTFDINPASPQILSAYLGTGQSAPVPLKLASGVQAPVLLIHANGDGGAPIQQSLAMRDALKASGKDVAFTDVNGSDEHPLESRETRLATLTALVDFLAKRNPAT